MLRSPLVIFDFLLGGKIPVRVCFPNEYRLVKLLLLQDLQFLIFKTIKFNYINILNITYIKKVI